MRERTLWPLLKRHLPGVHWQRFEGHRGVPDINGCDAGVEFWIEGKVARHGRLQFQRGQIAWIVEREHAGGLVYVLVRDEQDLVLYAGRQALRLSREGLSAVEPLLRVPAPWDWYAIRTTLRRGA